MLLFLFAIILVVAGMIAATRFLKRRPSWTPYIKWVWVVGVFLLFGILASTSFTYIDKDVRGHLDKTYGTESLPEGTVIAANGEKGPQAELLQPGFQSRFLLNIIYDVENGKIVEIPDSKFGFLVAKDGKPLSAGQTYADPFGNEEETYRMVADTKYFLTNGGRKGPQVSVLTPGRYPLNHYLWDVKIADITEIPEGHVGVIKSNAHTAVNYGNLQVAKPENCTSTIETAIKDGSKLETPLVPVGCVGVWNTALNPGRYYINTEAYKVTIVDTRVQAWEYRGGFNRREFKLSVDEDGKITQKEYSEDISRAEGSADTAISLKVEGWTVHQGVRVLVQVTPQNAPFVIASVGGLREVEDRIMTPALASELRNIVGGTITAPTKILDENGAPVLDAQTKEPQFREMSRPTKVLDLIENRSLIEKQVEPILKREGDKAGVVVKEIRLLDPDFPPELLLARKREQLAQQLTKAFEQEKLSQDARITTEQAKATANQQGKLVEAQIEFQRSEQIAKARKQEGQGERDKLNLIAEGQKAQASVLGEDRVVELRKFELILDQVFGFFVKNPGVMQSALENAHKFVPERLFMLGEGGSNNLAGALGVLGDMVGGDSQKKPAVQSEAKSQ